MAPADDLSTSSSGGSGDIFRHSPGTHDGEEETKRHMKTLEGLCHLYKLRAEDKEKRIVEIEQRIEQLERELAQCYASGEKLISTNASLQSMLDEREKSPDDRHSLCKGEADAKNKRIEELQQQKARLEEELDRCFASGEKLISSHTSLQETASSQEKSLAELHKLLKGEGSKNQDRVEDLQRQLGRREQELEQCFASGEKLISANAFLQRLVQERDARLTEQTSYIKRLEEEVGLRKEAVVRTEARPVSLCHVKADVGVMVKANGEEG